MRPLVSVFLCVVMIAGLLAYSPGRAQALPDDATIAGTVTDGTDPIEGAYVKVMMMIADGVGINYSFTDVNGDYSIGVPGGFDYMLFAVHEGHYFYMQMVSIGPDETLDVDLTMTPITETADVTIKGYVLDEVGDPVTTGNVIAISNDPLGMGDNMPYYGDVVQPDVAGYFEATVIASDYGGGAVFMDYPGVDMVGNETDTPLLSGMSYWFNISLESMVYNDDCRVSGTVTDGDGAPIEAVLVSIRSWNESSGDSSSNYTFTDATGSYAMDFVNGSCELTFTRSGYTVYMERFVVDPGADLTVDATLYALTGEMRGNVTDLSTGLPIADARVMQMNSTWTGENEGKAWYSIGYTDSAGYYEISTWQASGPSSAVGAEADGYVGNWTLMNMSGTGILWKDFGLAAVNAIVEGYVTDYLTGTPIADAWIWADSPYYSDGSSTDGTGYYSIPLPAGEFTVHANAMNYRYEEATVVVPDGGTATQDFALLPWDLPDTTKVCGWVNTSGSLTPIDGAEVQIALEDYSEQNSTNTDTTGYYEIMVPSVPLAYHVTAPNHALGYGLLDATGMAEIRLDMLLDPDGYAPNVTYSQAPTDNISAGNPSIIHIEVEEHNMNAIMLFQFMYFETVGAWEQYYIIGGASVSYDPWSLGGDLPCTVVGDVYTVDTSWDGTAQAGWLSNGTDQAYLWTYEILMYGMDPYYAFRAHYTNSTIVTPQTGTAFFDQATGEYAMFMFDDMGTYGTAYPDDLTGIVSPEITRIDVDVDTGSWMWVSGATLGNWSVVGLSFMFDGTVPSGDYKTLFITSDFGSHWIVQLTNVTVDNDPPVADAGADQTPIVNTTVILDGSGSSDNVGIVSYTWEYEDSTGTPVVLTGMTVDVVFDAVGDYVVTLTVVDGAGHEATDSVLISVLPDDIPVADAGPDQTEDEDTLVTFNGSGSHDDLGVSAYDWLIVELDEAMTGEAPEYTFADPGTYHVELVVTDTVGQESLPDEMVVTVTDTTDPVAVADADATNVSVGTEVTFDGSGSTDNSGSIASWTWEIELDGDVIATLSGEVESYTFDEVGLFTVTLTVEDDAGLTDTDSLEVTVYDDVPPVADAGADVEVVVGTEVTLNGSDSSDNVGIVNYTWAFVDGTAQVLWGETAEYTFDNIGEFNVTLTVMDAEGLTDTDYVTVRVVSGNEAPVADAGDDLAATAGDAVTFDGSGSSDEDLETLNYTWTFEYGGEGQILYGVSFEFVFDEAGEYEVTLTVTDSEGLSDSDTVSVTVEEAASTFIEDYWWALVAAIAAVVVLLAVLLVMRRGKGGSGKAEDEAEEEELVEDEESEEPPAPPEDEEL